MVNRKETNAFAKHLALFHPNEQGNIGNFNIKVESLFKKPLTRQKTRGRQNSIFDCDHRQPAMLRVRLTRENDDPDPAGGRVGAAGGARRPLRGRGV